METMTKAINQQPMETKTRAIYQQPMEMITRATYEQPMETITKGDIPTTNGDDNKDYTRTANGTISEHAQ